MNSLKIMYDSAVLYVLSKEMTWNFRMSARCVHVWSETSTNSPSSVIFS